MLLLGFDIGSSSVKACLVDSNSGNVIASSQSPDSEMPISAPRRGWAEQDPELWWEHVVKATRKLFDQGSTDPRAVGAIGIAYQMHGLVLTDNNLKPLRPSIIWCDSRAVDVGREASDKIGKETCLRRLLNTPGNFTASKLKWVADNEPHLMAKARYAMLPGDFIIAKMTGDVSTTVSALSEGSLWDFETSEPAHFVLEALKLPTGILPGLVPNFAECGVLTRQAAEELGLSPGVPVTYRSGDQPNNAMALGALKPGDVAGTGGTSGVVYAVTDRPIADPGERVNAFAHVNHRKDDPRIGILLCINGAGIQYAKTRSLMGGSAGYQEMEEEAAQIAVGSDGLVTLPFGNGAERMLGNRNVGAHTFHLDFNTHGRGHFFRSALEGIAFAFNYGLGILDELGLRIDKIRVGNDNLFRSRIFSQTVATVSNITIEIKNTSGAKGAALASGYGIGVFGSLEEAVQNVDVVRVVRPSVDRDQFIAAFEKWKIELNRFLI